MARVSKMNAPFVLVAMLLSAAWPGVAPASVDDTTPDVFAFAEVDGVMPGVTVTSEAIALTGFTSAEASIENGLFSVGCDGDFGVSPKTVVNGDTICILQRASYGCETYTASTLHVGTVSGTFVTRTRTFADGCINPPAGGGGAMPPSVVLLLLMLAVRRRRATVRRD